MFDVFIMDMGGHDENVQQILSKLPHAQTMRYMTSHLEMVKRAASKSRTEYFWLIASCCDYNNFNFGYIPKPWESEQIHCWASGQQKFGDTFLINVTAWKKQENVEKLEWYKSINWHKDGVPRLAWPLVKSSPNLAKSVVDHKFDALCSVFYTSNAEGTATYDNNLWDKREIIAFNRTGHVTICPRDVKQQIKTQIFDYRYIKYVKDENIAYKSQDIVFLSYDEKNADDNWKKLQSSYPRAKRVHGVKGLVPAIKAAAEESTTDWFYIVFGKTEIVDSFKFDYCPNYLQHPANYVFHAYNPILDHSYGHDGIILHDREWVKNIKDWDLDLTMSHHVVTVPILSCINRLDISSWSAWRTAFREAYKLSYYLDRRKSLEDEYHLHLWLTKENTEAGKFSKLGANQGRDYYLNNKKDYSVNDWSWLEKLFNQTMKELQNSDLDGQTKQQD
jgi:hypothetical protein